MSEVVEQEPTVEQSAPSVAVDGRRVAHRHPADKRANQHGPIVEGGFPVGRQKAEDCYETKYDVRNPGGLKINEVLYRGRVTVPECVANYLNEMDQKWEDAERALFRNNSLSQIVGHVGG